MRNALRLAPVALLLVSCVKPSLQGDHVFLLEHAIPGEVLTWGSTVGSTVGVVCAMSPKTITIAIVEKNTCATAEKLPAAEWALRYRDYQVETSYHSSLIPEEIYYSRVKYLR